MGFTNLINESLSNLADYRIIFDVCGASGIILASGGFLPKFGIVRAITLGFRSLLPAFPTKSERTQETAKLKSSIKNLSVGKYIVVTGKKGIGKSCLINTAVHFTLGVVKVNWISLEDKDAIIRNVQQKITNIWLFPFELTGSTHRVLFFYRLFFRSTPIVVISVRECQQNDKYADLTEAVKCLTEKFRLRVIIDGSLQSIPLELLNSKRESVVYIDSMDKNVIESIPEWKELVDFLKSHKLDQVVYDVLGGSPSDYINLRHVFRGTAGSTEDKIKSIRDFIRNRLYDALYDVVSGSSENTKDIVELFCRAKTLEMPLITLAASQFILDSPNKVFRRVKRGSGIIAEPASPAVGLIIKHNVKNDVDVKKLVDNLFAALP